MIAPDAAARRALASAVTRVGRERGLLAFGAADTHLHLLALSDRPGAGLLARGTELALRAALALPVAFGAPAITPIEDQRHLMSAFGYVQRNARRHGNLDPMATEASSLHDLLALRRNAPWLILRVKRALPRVTRASLLELMAMPDFGCDGAVSSELADAAAAAFALPDLAGKAPEAVRARLAGIALVKGVWTPQTIAATFHICERAVRRIASQTADPLDVVALRRQLAWRSAARLAARSTDGF